MDFDEFIDSQREMKETPSPEEAKEKVKVFEERLNELYAIVDQVLKPYVQDGSVTISTKEQRLTEENFFGFKEYPYTVKEKVIQIGNSIVRLTPLGIKIIGAAARVDMNGPRGKIAIILTPSGGPRVNVSVYPEGQTPPKKSVQTPQEDLVWQFAERSPRLHYLEVNDNTFKNNLMKVING